MQGAALSIPTSPARTRRAPGRYAQLDKNSLTDADVLLRDRQDLDIDYRVKIPKPHYVDNTEARKQARANAGLRVIPDSIVRAPTPGGKAAKGKTSGIFKSLGAMLSNPTVPAANRPGFYGGSIKKYEEYEL